MSAHLSGSPVVHWLVLAAAGAAGTVARAAVTDVAVRLCGTAFPWGTLGVNLLGAAAFGGLAAAGRARLGLPPGLEAVLLVGLLGGFTTFSSYAFQAVELWLAGRHSVAIAYVLASNTLGLAAVWAGLRLAGAPA
jgi:CrcB protein